MCVFSFVNKIQYYKFLKFISKNNHNKIEVNIKIKIVENSPNCSIKIVLNDLNPNVKVIKLSVCVWFHFFLYVNAELFLKVIS